MIRQRLFCGVTLLACVMLAGIARADEAEAVAAIEKIGGTVRSVAQDSQDKDVAFHLSGTGLTDDGLAEVAKLSNVIWLNLRGTKITDAGLAHLANLKSLRKLHLEKTAVTDAGLAHLAGLENLEYLNLYGTQVTDAGLQQLKGLKSLKKLFVWETPVTAAGAADLQAAIPELKVNRGADAEPSPPTKTLATGRFVRVRLEGDQRILSLAEVQVLETATGKELQTAGTARQSSVGSDGAPERAIDGKPDGTYSNGSVSHTADEKNPWWLVDLGDARDIGSIVIHNRADCCGDRLKDAVVEVFDQGLNVVWSGKVTDAADGSVTKFVAP
ncbi:MAG: discoidin domain-containing protein [Pirellulales bacterium]